MVPRQEKLHRMKLLKELLQAAVIEGLGGFAEAPGSQREHPGLDDGEGVQRDMLSLFLAVKKRQQRRLRPENLKQPVHGFLEQHWTEELQRVPNQGSVERLLGEFQSLPKEKIGAPGIGLIGHKISVGAERFVQRVQNIIGINAVAETGDETDVGLAGAPKIQDRQALAFLDGAEKLLQTVAGPGL